MGTNHAKVEKVCNNHFNDSLGNTLIDTKEVGEIYNASSGDSNDTDFEFLNNLLTLPEEYGDWELVGRAKIDNKIMLHLARFIDGQPTSQGKIFIF